MIPVAEQPVEAHVRTIELNERPFATGRQTVDLRGNNFLAGTAFAQNKDRDAGWRDFGYNVLQNSD
jgi:hypothetical protein